jgi:CrcB protein
MNMIIYNILLVAFGGALGAVCRYLVSLAVKLTGPWVATSTWLVNTLGCFIIGLLAGWLLNASVPSDTKSIYNLLLVTGFCGGFTTFSSFALDTIKYLDNNQLPAAIIYVLASVIVGITSTALGLYIASKI